MAIMPEGTNHRNSHAEARALIGDPRDLASTISTMTDEELAQFANDLDTTDTDLAMIEELSERIRGMSDTDVSRSWGIQSPELIADIRALFAGSWRS